MRKSLVLFESCCRSFGNVPSGFSKFWFLLGLGVLIVLVQTVALADQASSENSRLGLGDCTPRWGEVAEQCESLGELAGTVVLQGPIVGCPSEVESGHDIASLAGKSLSVHLFRISNPRVVLSVQADGASRTALYRVKPKHVKLVRRGTGFKARLSQGYYALQTEAPECGDERATEASQYQIWLEVERIGAGRTFVPESIREQYRKKSVKVLLWIGLVVGLSFLIIMIAAGLSWS